MEEEPLTQFNADYFERLYQANADPWNFRNSWRERLKYAATVRALGRRHYGRVLEIGCSIGILSRMLARRTDALVALDISTTAIAAARARNADLGHIGWLAAGFLEADLKGPFDLIVFSEVLYYLTPDELALASMRALELLAPGGEVLIVSWLGKGHHPMSGDEATDGFVSGLGAGFSPMRCVRNRRYRLDHLRCATQENAAP